MIHWAKSYTLTKRSPGQNLLWLPMHLYIDCSAEINGIVIGQNFQVTRNPTEDFEGFIES